ncbi:PIN domain-containing protein [Candidatus Pacearchaeota archaeon]|nr:PIN domain-containing protein [Candidatus Pacearchaeota archaeon]
MTEEEKRDSKLLDSSIWLSYFLEGKYKDIIEVSQGLFLSVLSLFEVQRKLHKSSLDKEKIKKSIEFIKEKSIILALTEEIANRAVEIAVEKNLPTIDSLTNMTVIINNKIIYTEDNDFRGLLNAVVFEKQKK